LFADSHHLVLFRFYFFRLACSLVCGDVRGRHESLFAKVGALNKSHGPFHALFCVGQFFGNDNDELQPYISSAKQIPIPTYFVCGNEPQFTLLQDDNKEVCTNLKFLGTQRFCFIVQHPAELTEMLFMQEDLEFVTLQVSESHFYPVSINLSHSEMLINHLRFVITLDLM
jgi:hypothetical protein